MPLKLYTASTVTAFTLNEAKEHLRKRDSDEDGYIQALIDVVANHAETVTRRALGTSTWQYFLDCFPSYEIALPKPPLQSVTHVKYRDLDGTLLTLDPSLYQVDLVSEPGRIVPAPSEIWPPTEYKRINSVEIQFVAGYSDRYKIPPGLRQAMLYHLSHLFDIREPVVVGTISANIPFSIEAMYASHRIYGFY